MVTIASPENPQAELLGMSPFLTQREIDDMMRRLRGGSVDDAPSDQRGG